MAEANPLAYMQDQMIQKAITLIKKCGLFPTILLKWQAGPSTKNWNDLKQHFGEAYELVLRLGTQGRVLQGGTANAANYSLYNAQEDNDTIASITDALGSTSLENNVNVVAVREDVSTLRVEVSALRALLQQGVQQGGTAAASNTMTAWGGEHVQPPPPPCPTTGP